MSEFNEPWTLDEFGTFIDASGERIPDLALPGLRRIADCVNACAGIPDDVVTMRAFVEMVWRAAQVLQFNPHEGGNSEQADQSGMSAGNGELPRSLPGDIEEIVERVLAKHGILQPAAAEAGAR